MDDHRRLPRLHEGRSVSLLLVAIVHRHVNLLLQILVLVSSVPAANLAMAVKDSSSLDFDRHDVVVHSVVVEAYSMQC